MFQFSWNTPSETIRIKQPTGFDIFIDSFSTSDELHYRIADFIN